MPAAKRRSAQIRCGLALAGVLGAAACEESGPTACVPEPGDVCGLAGTGELGFNRDGLPAAQTDLFLVSAARRGPDELVYLMDFNNQRLRRITEDGLVETTIGSGFHALADTSVPAVDSPLENPIDFGFLSDGRLVFVSYHDPRVLVLNPSGSLEVLAGAGEVGVEGNEGDGGPATEALFMQLDGIAVAADDSLYVSDSLAHRVRWIHDGLVTTVAGTGEAGFAGDGGPATEAQLNWPTALELTDSGSLLIADARNHAVRELSPDGTLTTIAGQGTPGFGGDGGAGTEALLNQPYGLALDEDGSLYIGDRANFRVRVLSPQGTISTLGGVGTEGDTGDGGSAAAAEFGYVARLALDGDQLLVADQSNSRVRTIRLR